MYTGKVEFSVSTIEGLIQQLVQMADLVQEGFFLVSKESVEGVEMFEWEVWDRKKELEDLRQ